MPILKNNTLGQAPRALIISLGLICIYLALSCLIHHWLLPELPISPQLAPERGTLITNSRAGEEIRVLRDRFETDVAFVQIEVTLAPGGSVPLAHIHSNTEERFVGVEGTTVLTVDGGTHLLNPGETLIVPPGISHVPSNPSSQRVRFQVTFPALSNLDIFLVQVHGFLGRDHEPPSLPDQALQLMRYADAYDVYLAGPPLRLQMVGLWLLTPTLRMLGYRRFSSRATLTNPTRVGEP
ncbi:uncharacterized protein METZ01_LOCUS193516 [marine metagenome]|uniref:Cupin type-2 domain-containing protein n=1 Tax=marine metagenome TaxID=408172 RepID=A0A382DRG0_9ZZZZ